MLVDINDKTTYLMSVLHICIHTTNFIYLIFNVLSTCMHKNLEVTIAQCRIYAITKYSLSLYNVAAGFCIN